MLEAVAIGAMVHAPAIKRLNALKLRHNILQAGRKQDLLAITVPSSHTAENLFSREAICFTRPARSVTVLYC